MACSCVKLKLTSKLLLYVPLAAPSISTSLPAASPQKCNCHTTTHVVRALKDEQKTTTTLPPPLPTLDFDEKLPLFAPLVFYRTFLVGTIVGINIALGADFLGITSAILSLNPKFSCELQVDILYLIHSYKRFLKTSKGFGDQTLLYQAVQRGENESSLDLPVLRR